MQLGTGPVAAMPPEGAPAGAEGSRRGRAQARSVAILLCTFNGARFLPLQLASYEAQDSVDWRLFVSDDGSQDGTLALLADFQNRHGAQKVAIRRGPCTGFAANFLSLICDPTIEGDYFALSDQDDVWDAHKLARARQFLNDAPANLPVVYCSRTRLIDERGSELGLSRFYKKAPHFRNALVQSLASGNTMVLNTQMRRLLMRAGPDVQVASHDWWIYLAATAVGGQIIYDSAPTVSYRMHSRNVIGSNESAVAKIVRARLLAQGRFKSWADMNVGALERIETLMTDENRKTFELFQQSRKGGLALRLCGLVRSGVYRQSLVGDVGLLAAALVGKI
jgi:glycosyltransferase involved in cell wall biosynthesis